MTPEQMYERLQKNKEFSADERKEFARLLKAGLRKLLEQKATENIQAIAKIIDRYDKVVLAIPDSLMAKDLMLELKKHELFKVRHTTDGYIVGLCHVSVVKDVPFEIPHDGALIIHYLMDNPFEPNERCYYMQYQ